MNGTVTRIIKEKGFGFIESNGKEYFFHRSVVKNNYFDRLKEGQNVIFDEAINAPRGPRASFVEGI